MEKTFRISDFEGDPRQIVREIPSYHARRAALVSVGVLYEDFDGELSPEMIDSADKILAERQPT